MKTLSIIRHADKVENKNAHFNADKEYYMVYVSESDGTLTECLLTEEALEVGKIRASSNKEDVLPLHWFTKLGLWLFGK